MTADHLSYDYDGIYYYVMGLYQIWFSPKLTAKKDMFADPPRFRQNVNEWLAERSATLGFDIAGVPTLVFLRAQDRTDFIAEFEPATDLKLVPPEHRKRVE